LLDRLRSRFHAVILVLVAGLCPTGPALAAAMTVVRLAPDASLETYLSISGDIEVGDWSAFSRILRANPNIAGVALSSMGGSLDDGLAIAKQIHDRELDTLLVDVCHSVCSIMFLAGQDRYAPEGFRLSVHTAYKQVADWTVQDHVANGTVTWFLGYMGYPLQLAQLWVATDADDAALVTWAHNDRWRLGFKPAQVAFGEPQVIAVATPP
jgi:hypothetical protein